MAIEYQDFTITFNSGPDETFTTRLATPAGDGRETFQLGPDGGAGLALRPLISWWDTRLRGARLLTPASAAGLSPEEVGGRLFDALFHGRARILLDRSLGLVQGRDQGLRFVFNLDLQDPATEPLSRLPWELLFDRQAREFLALDQRTPVVRDLADVERTRLLQPLREPPRVLAAVGSAEGLDQDFELKNLADSLAGSGVDLEPLVDATAERLAGRLRRRKVHILHFIGHGDFDQASGEGRLYLRDDVAGAKALKGSEIAPLLNGAGELRFAFLNACSTAETGGADGRSPYAGVASALVKDGVPAVLAMQAPVPDRSAIEFSQVVYEHIARGDSLEEAVSSGRAELHRQHAESGAWAIPVLFTRVRERVITPASLSLLGWLWTLLGLASATFSFNAWSDTQLWKIRVPGLHFPPVDSYTAGYYGILWGIPLLAVLLLVTWRYPLLRRGDSFEERLPVAFGLSLGRLGSLRRTYQAVSFTLVFLLPIAAQVHFFDKINHATVKDWGEPRFPEPVTLSSGVWTRIPFDQLDDDHWNRFKFDDETTCYPFWGTLGLLALELGLLVFFLSIAARLFARPGGRTRPFRLPRARGAGSRAG